MSASNRASVFPGLVIDGTGLTTTTPLTVKNGKSQSGIVVQVTGTAASGFVLADSTPTNRGAFGYAVSNNDWVTQAVAGDVVIAGDASHFVRIGPLGGANTLFNFDLVNSRLGIGVGSNTPTRAIDIFGSDTASARIEVAQSSASSQAMIELTRGSCAVSIKALGASAAGTTLGVTHAGGVTMQCDPTAVGFIIGTNSAFPIIFGTNATQKAQIDSAGNFIVGTAAVLTTATDGFLYIPSCAGTPTGVPTTKTGRVPMVWDSTNKKFYIYDFGAAAWLGGTAPGVFS